MNTDFIHWILVFLVIALVCAAVGLGGIAGVALFAVRIFAVLFVVALLVSLFRR